MSSLRTLTLAIAALAIAPSAFAQDSSTDYGSGKRVSVVVGGALLEPTTNPEIAGLRSNIDGALAPTLGVSYLINDNWAIEAWGAADSFSHRVTTASGRAGNVDSQPFALSGQYRFGTASTLVRPFVGLGYYENNFNDESTAATGDFAGSRLGVETAKGAMATVGVDVNFSPTWFARADARYMQGKSDFYVDGVKAGDADLNPVALSLGVGARF